MGCDIHIWAEIQREDEDKWWVVGHEFDDEFRRPEEIAIVWSYGGPSDEEEDARSYAFTSHEQNAPKSIHPYDGRNYNLFSILADVRNGYGFAGVDTGDGFVPITKPRGVPEDASHYFRHQVAEWGPDGHSHSWISLLDLIDYDWQQVTKKRGWVRPDQYGIWKAKGAPESWSGGISGGNVRHLTNEQMDVVSTFPEGPTYVTQVEWEWTYAECCEGFVEKTIPALQELLTRKGVRDLRIVFFFDN